MPAITVLVVDDDPPFRRVAGELLTTLGYQVVSEAGDATEALAARARTHPAAALVDVNLREVDGLALTRRLLADDPRLRVLLTSTDPAATTADAVADAGAIGFVPKTQLAVTDLACHLGAPSG
jgi:DNA-binding NarL/FixJ family response regulator